MPFDFSTRRYISPTEGGGSDPKLTTVTIPPSVVSQVVLPPEGYDGFNEVAVPAVTATIDPNIAPNNIVKGCNILGVIGESNAINPEKYGLTIDDFFGNTINGVYYGVNSVKFDLNVYDAKIIGSNGFKDFKKFEVVNFSLPNVTKVENDGFYNSFSSSLRNLYVPNLIDAGVNAFRESFYYTPNMIEINFPSLVDAGKNCFYISSGGSSNQNKTKILFPNLVNVSNNAFYRAFGWCYNCKEINLSSVQSVNASGFAESFMYLCYVPTINDPLKEVSFPNVVNLGTCSGYTSGAFAAAFSLSNIEKISFESLKTTNGSQNAFSGMASSSKLITLSFPNLTDVPSAYAFKNCCNGCNARFSNFYLPNITNIYGSYAFVNCCYNCKNLENVNFPSLKKITGGFCFQNCFANSGLKSLFFNSLSQASINSFNNMLRNVIGCTVHFPSNVESVIGSWDDVMSGFGGINTVVLFDL